MWSLGRLALTLSGEASQWVQHLLLGDVTAKTFERGLSQLLAPEMLTPPAPRTPKRPARKAPPARATRPSR